MQKKIYWFEFWATPKIIQSDRRLGPIDKDVMSVLITRMNGENYAKIKQQTIADDLGYSIRAIAESIKTLEKIGYIRNQRIGKKCCNIYKINKL